MTIKIENKIDFTKLRFNLSSNNLPSNIFFVALDIVSFLGI